MSFWTAVVVIVIVGVLCEMYKARLKAGRRGSDGHFRDLSQRTDRLEERMGNIETIVLDGEKLRGFRDL